MSLPEVGENVVICTHLAIRDDAHLLYGFLTESERKLFRCLFKNQWRWYEDGVGDTVGNDSD